MALPVNPPIRPMLAGPVTDIPDSGDFAFEPKWDGFRCLVYVDPAADTPVLLHSRTLKPFNRYFPEIVEAFESLVDCPLVLDGELVVTTCDDVGQRLDWDALSERIHPAQRRVRMLAERTPARFVAFDLLGVDDRDLRSTGFADRRRALDEIGPLSERVGTTPVTGDPERAREWFRVFEGAGLDGIIAKPDDLPYLPGKRAMLKVKHARTADCVVAGLRWHANTEPGTAVGSLLLGLYDDAGVLHHVGVVGAFAATRRRELATELRPLLTTGAHPWTGADAEDGRRLPGAINRWRSSEQQWQPLRPERVVEVSYDHVEGTFPYRFRHTTQFQRWRPDRDPRSCGYAQLEEPARYDLDALLRGAAVDDTRQDT